MLSKVLLGTLTVPLSGAVRAGQVTTAGKTRTIAPVYAMNKSITYYHRLVHCHSKFH